MENVTNVIKWAEKSLLDKGYTINGPLADIQTTAWSSVKRFSTTNGYIYLKVMAPMLSLEPVITQVLHDQIHANVPIVVDINKGLNCYLMEDSGSQLRESLKSSFQLDLFCQAIKNYTYIQYAAVAYINIFLKLGVPDWRLNKLPTLYTQLIGQEDLLKEDGLTFNEVNMLHELFPQFESMCKLLSHYKIPETLDHCDFHDGNILIDDTTNTASIIDWGETVITHPFFSLISCLNNAVHRYTLKETDKVFIQLQETCFNNVLFEDVPKNDLFAADRLARKLQPIYRVLGFYRLKMSSNVERFKSWPEGHGCLARPLKEFIRISKLVL